MRVAKFVVFVDGFGPCVTLAEIDNQGSAGPGFCPEALGAIGCTACPAAGVKPGDIVCSPDCGCAPMPPICGVDAGTD